MLPRGPISEEARLARNAAQTARRQKERDEQTASEREEARVAANNAHNRTRAAQREVKNKVSEVIRIFFSCLIDSAA